MSLSDMYKKHTHREHIYNLPDTYIGSIENSMEDHYVLEDESFTQKSLMFNPGFYKLIDELLVNAHDHVIRLRERKSDNLVKNISINCDTNTFRIRNDGESIDIEKHPEYGVYIPQLIFGELLTSSNFDDEQERVTGGRNGIGIKLNNIFSSYHNLFLLYNNNFLDYS